MSPTRPAYRGSIRQQGTEMTVKISTPVPSDEVIRDQLRVPAGGETVNQVQLLSGLRRL